MKSIKLTEDATKKFREALDVFMIDPNKGNAMLDQIHDEQQKETLGQKFDKMLEFDETIDVNSREELVEKYNKYVEKNFGYKEE